jgi:iron complex outermembrane recepter protein
MPRLGLQQNSNKKLFMKNTILFVFCLIAVNTLAQTGKIKGTIKTANQEPAAYVNVVIKGTQKGTTSNVHGQFEIKSIQPGSHVLSISYVGFEPKDIPVEIVAGETTTLAEIVLAETSEKLDEILVSASKLYKEDLASSSLRIQTPLIETPQNIQVVTGRVIQEQQLFDMLEGITKNVSGATRSEHWDNYANIIMRGTQIGSFRNGMNVQMPWGPLVEDMSMVERIEFVKGPAGFMLANGEPSGFYNVVTKKPTGITKGEATVTLGSFDTYRTTLDLDGKLDKDGKLLYRFNMMGQLKGSHRDYDYNNRYTIVPVITYKIDEKTSITAEYTRQFSRMALIGAAYVFSPKYGELPRNFTLAEPNLEPSDMKDQSIFVTFNRQLNDSWKLTSQLAYIKYNQRAMSNWPSSPVGIEHDGTVYRNIGLWDAASDAKLGQVFLTGEAKTGAVVHRILAGIDIGSKNYMADWNQSAALQGYGYDEDGNYVPVDFNLYAPVHGNVPAQGLPNFDRSLPLSTRAGGNIIGESYSSIYVQDEVGFLNDRIRLTLAGRYTSIEQNAYGSFSDDGQFTPRAGVSFSLNKENAIYGLYDQAFVPQQGIDNEKNRPLVPVTGSNFEVGYKRDWMGGRWNSTLSLYQITRNNVVSYRPGPTTFATQLGQTQTKGVEFDVRGELVAGLNVTFNYAFTTAEVTEDEDPEKVGQIVPGSGFADHVSNGWLSYQVHNGALQGVGFSLGYQWQGGRNAWDWGANTESAAKLPDYFRVDGALSWRSDKMTVAVNVNNIFDQYLYSGAPYELDNDSSTKEYYYQIEPGTNYRFTIGYRF